MIFARRSIGHRSAKLRRTNLGRAIFPRVDRPKELLRPALLRARPPPPSLDPPQFRLKGSIRLIAIIEESHLGLYIGIIVHSTNHLLVRSLHATPREILRNADEQSAKQIGPRRRQLLHCRGHNVDTN
uniref:Uncharacterized protein n=1 Tax=Plectus sambesii TaxID=2011161 RepID=A0A914W0L1_9BILA